MHFFLAEEHLMSQLHFQSDNEKNVIFKTEDIRAYKPEITNNIDFNYALITRLTLYIDNLNLGEIESFFILDFIQEYYCALSHALSDSIETKARFSEYELELRFLKVKNKIKTSIAFSDDILFSDTFSINSLLLFHTKLSFFASNALTKHYRESLDEINFYSFFDNLAQMK